MVRKLFILSSALSLIFICISSMPAKANAVSGTVIDVTDYGADPSGQQESTTAVQKAIEYAATLPATEQKFIVFPKGEYHFYADYAEQRELYISNTTGIDEKYKNKYIAILIEGIENMTIDGEGSLFIMHGDIMSFATIGSKNITFKNFSFDHASPSVVDVTVESTYDKTIFVYIPECYNYTISGTNIFWKGEEGPVTKKPYWQGKNGLNYSQIYDYESGRTWRISGDPLFNNVKSIDDIGNNRLKITYNKEKLTEDIPRNGTVYQLRNTTRTTAGALFMESKNISMKHIDAHFLHGFGIVGQLSDTITLDSVNFVSRPGNGRVSASFADFIQMSSVKGKITIENNVFSTPHDDPINIHGTYMTVGKVSEDNKTFILHYKHNETGGFQQFYSGNEVEFITKGTMIPVSIEGGTPKITNVIFTAGSNEIKITLDKAVPGITGGDNSYAVENITYTPDVLIRNNRFINSPTRGILCTTRGEVLIEGNYFDAIGMAGIYISSDAQDWYESGPTKNVTIRNNVFDRLTSHAVLVDPTNPSNDPNTRIHSNMTIKDNVFNLESNAETIKVKSMNGLDIKNNVFNIYKQNNNEITIASDKTHRKYNHKYDNNKELYNKISNYLYRIKDSDNVTIKNNIYNGIF